MEQLLLQHFCLLVIGAKVKNVRKSIIFGFFYRPPAQQSLASVNNNSNNSINNNNSGNNNNNNQIQISNRSRSNRQGNLFCTLTKF